MAIKSKNTNLPINFFVGLISWFSFLSLVYFLSCFTAGLVLVVLKSKLAGAIGEMLYLFPAFQKIPRELLIRSVSVLLLIILNLVLTILFRKERKQFELALARFLSHIWIELKITIIPLSIYAISYTNNFWFLLFSIIFSIYLFCLDIGYNKTIFRKNLAAAILHSLNKAKKDSLYEYTAIKRMISTIAVIVGILLVSTVAISFVHYLETSQIIGPHNSSLIMSAIVIFSASGTVGSIAWYYLSHKKDLEDLSQIMIQIEKMYAGNLNAVNHIPPNSQFYDMAMQMNMIRTGIEKAVDEGIKADRTKVELITNVSHDIKTPLTSIITYIELLKKEENLPKHVQDYVQTLSNKANRLSHIVQDVFEVSKAATGNLALSIDTLDLTKLVQQTLAEMEESMYKAPLTWRVDLSEESLMIQADGQKMYRVFQNLIRNCAQYALEGSRAYITLKKVNQCAEFTIRNVARTELDSSAAEYLTGRFIRGDQNRTTEGSGLGLSIAKSFTEACGGQFKLHIDEDIFLVRISFALDIPVPSTPPAAIEENDSANTNSAPKESSLPIPAVSETDIENHTSHS